MKNNIPPKILARLNHTNNPHLIAHRKENILKIILINIYKIFKIHILSLLSGNDIQKSYHRRNKLDKLWIIFLLKVYKTDLLLSEGYGKKIPFWNGFRFCVIDKQIAPAIFALNKLGIKTNNSCEGNQDKGHSSTAYITTYPGYKLPKELLSFLEKENILYRFTEKNSQFIGDSLHAKNSKDNEIFIKALTKWAKEKGINDIDKLKYL
jgi:hypothetical protein